MCIYYIPLTCFCVLTILFSPPKADLEATLREVYAIPADTPCQVWHQYMSHTYALLSNPSQTLQDAGLYNMQVVKYFWEHRVVINVIYSYTRPLLLKNRTQMVLGHAVHPAGMQM